MQYLKLIVKSLCFDHQNCTFALGVMVFAPEIKMHVHFSFDKKLQKHVSLKNDFFIVSIISLKVFEPQRSTISQINPLEE